jgi:lipoprotein NlpD
VVTASNRKKTPKNRGIVKNESYQNLKLRWQWPTQGRVGAKFRRGDQTRKGVLLSGRLGQGIKAAEAGTVVYSGSGLVGYGKLVIIKHNKNYLSAYGHNRKLMVKEGDRVKKGTHIADMGKNGSGNTVLHFEIRRNGIPVDPLPLLPRRS